MRQMKCIYNLMIQKDTKRATLIYSSLEHQRKHQQSCIIIFLKWQNYGHKTSI